MRPMNIAEKPIAAIQGRRTSTGDGVHLIANHYKKGVRLDTHMHREAQLVYAAKGTMQVTTPRGRCWGRRIARDGGRPGSNMRSMCSPTSTCARCIST